MTRALQGIEGLTFSSTRCLLSQKGFLHRKLEKNRLWILENFFFTFTLLTHDIPLLLRGLLEPGDHVVELLELLEVVVELAGVDYGSPPILGEVLVVDVDPLAQVTLGWQQEHGVEFDADLRMEKFTPC